MLSTFVVTMSTPTISCNVPKSKVIDGNGSAASAVHSSVCVGDVSKAAALEPEVTVTEVGATVIGCAHSSACEL